MGAWPIFDIEVSGFPPFPLTARTRGAALAAALHSYQNYDDRMRMRDFMRIARVRRRREPLTDDGYGYVRRAYGVDPAIGQRGILKGEGPGFNGREVTVIYPNKASTAYVHIATEDGLALVVHPSNIDLAPSQNGGRDGR